MKTSNTSKRLKEIMTSQQLKQINILEKAAPYCKKYNIKLTKVDLSQYVSGKVEPGQAKLFILANALNVNEAWLMGYEVSMNRDDYEDQKIISFDTELDDALKIIELAGYSWDYGQSPDVDLIIKDKSNQIVACMHDYELVSRYESLQRKGTVTAESLLTNSEQAFISYLDSLGYHLYIDDPEHKPFMTSCKLNHDTIDSLKHRIDNYTRVSVDSELLTLKEEEIKKERFEKEKIIRQLNGENIYKGTQYEKDLNAAHRRTDIEVTNDDRKADEDIMDDDNF